ncbi:MAG: hypothetical protein ACRBCI_10870 [Cellvibrionaceae bacterium]
MSIWLKSIIVTLALSMCSIASAAPSYDFASLDSATYSSSWGFFKPYKKWNKKWKKKLKKWKKIKNKKKPTPTPKAVPELDSATAPLAALLLGGLLAAGVERRRRKSSDK